MVGDSFHLVGPKCGLTDARVGHELSLVAQDLKRAGAYLSPAELDLSNNPKLSENGASQALRAIAGATNGRTPATIRLHHCALRAIPQELLQRPYPLQLHVSHNWLGESVIVAAVRHFLAAKRPNRQAVYPQTYSRGTQPLWLRTEGNPGFAGHFPEEVMAVLNRVADDAGGGGICYVPCGTCCPHYCHCEKTAIHFYLDRRSHQTAGAAPQNPAPPKPAAPPAARHAWPVPASRWWSIPAPTSLLFSPIQTSRL